MSKIKVAVTGICGRMGREVAQAVLEQDDLELVLAVDRSRVGEDVSAVIGGANTGVTIRETLTSESLKETGAQVLVDFTVASAALGHAMTAVVNGVSPIIGTSGLSETDLNTLKTTCEAHQQGALFIPNFGIGAVLMMRFAQEAAKYFPNVEIIELHHDGKIDAPSQTAIRTAELIGKAREKVPRSFGKEQVKAEGARGAEIAGCRVHSVRLSGLLAHQEVIFGGTGEALTVRHDSMDRKSFMPGVILAIRKVSDLTGLVTGLESIL